MDANTGNWMAAIVGASLESRFIQSKFFFRTPICDSQNAEQGWLSSSSHFNLVFK